MKLLRLFFLSAVFSLFFTFSCLATAVEDLVHYVGKSRFPISGTHSTSQCNWDISGSAVLFLSFSRSSSLAAIRIKKTETVTKGDINVCTNSTIVKNYIFPLTIEVTKDQKLFSAQSPDQIQFIRGESKNLEVKGDYLLKMTNVEQQIDMRWSGNFSATLKIVPGELLDLSDVKGRVLSTLPIGISEKSSTIADATTLLTEKDSYATLIEKYGSKIKIKPSTLLTRMPVKKTALKEIRRYLLLRGKVESSIKTKDRDFQLITPIVSIKPSLVNNVMQRSDFDTGETTEFVVENSYNNNIASTTIDVTSGSVEVTTLSGEEQTVSAGSPVTYTDTINRTSWVQPSDGGALYEGVENILVWMQYPSAAGYIIEYNIPSPIFTQENSNLVEYEKKSIILTPDMYTVYDDLAILYLPIEDSGLEGILLETRIYAIDENNEIIPDSVSSDKVSVTFQ